MWQKLLYSILTYLIEKLLNLAVSKWEEYREDQEKQEELKRKVKALKDAKTKDEIRSAIRNLSI